MMESPAEFHLEGLLDLAAKKGLKTVALINADDLPGRTTRQGTIELAKKKGLQVVFADAYPPRDHGLLRDPDHGAGGKPRRAGRRHTRF